MKELIKETTLEMVMPNSQEYFTTFACHPKIIVYKH